MAAQGESPKGGECCDLRLAFAGLKPCHFGKKFGANAGRRRLILGAERRLPRDVAIAIKEAVAHAQRGGKILLDVAGSST
jgi:hypothetical protein